MKPMSAKTRQSDLNLSICTALLLYVIKTMHQLNYKHPLVLFGVERFKDLTVLVTVNSGILVNLH